MPAWSLLTRWLRDGKLAATIAPGSGTIVVNLLVWGLRISITVAGIEHPVFEQRL